MTRIRLEDWIGIADQPVNPNGALTTALGGIPIYTSEYIPIDQIIVSTDPALDQFPGQGRQIITMHPLMKIQMRYEPMLKEGYYALWMSEAMGWIMDQTEKKFRRLEQRIYETRFDD